MLILMATLCTIGGIMSLIGGIMFLVAAFRKSALWGLAVLLIPFAGLVFLFKYWADAKRAFLIQLCGMLLSGGGFAIGVTQGLATLGDMTAGLPLPIPDLFTSGGVEMQPDEIDDTEPEDPPPAPEPEPAKLPADPRTMIGKSLAEARRVFGKPRGTMQSRDKMSVFYDGFWLYSEDGRTVSDVEMDSDFKALRTVVAPPPVWSNDTASGDSDSPGAADDSVQTLSNGGQRVNLTDLLVPGKITLVDFYADWCGPCRKLSPSLEELAREDPDVCLRKVDIVKWGTPICEQHKIKSVPNVRVFDRNGKIVGSPTHSLDEIKAGIAEAK